MTSGKIVQTANYKNITLGKKSLSGHSLIGCRCKGDGTRASATFSGPVFPPAAVAPLALAGGLPRIVRFVARPDLLIILIIVWRVCFARVDRSAPLLPGVLAVVSARARLRDGWDDIGRRTFVPKLVQVAVPVGPVCAVERIGDAFFGLNKPHVSSCDAM
jgi:hypothetical protein